MDCHYEFDATNRLLSVSDNWDHIAERNDATDLTRERVLGCELKSLLHDGGARAIYDALFRKVRSGRDKVSFEFRCDTPIERRTWLMTIGADQVGTVRIENSLLDVSPRTVVALLQHGDSNTDDFVIMCSWCMRLKTGINRWQEIEEGIETLKLFKNHTCPLISHSICHDCTKEMMQRIDNA
jgi:hypothetical protein